MSLLSVHKDSNCLTAQMNLCHQQFKAHNASATPVSLLYVKGLRQSNHRLSSQSTSCQAEVLLHILSFTEIASVTENQHSSPCNKVIILHSPWHHHRFSQSVRQSVRVFAFIIVVLTSRHLQPEPTRTWHSRGQPDTNSLLCLPSITQYVVQFILLLLLFFNEAVVIKH